MADSCSNFLTNLAAQTPVYDQRFLEDWKPLDSPIIGRHETDVWKTGTGDIHTSDQILIGQPNLTNPWQQLSAMGCADTCDVPSIFVGFGTQRRTYFLEAIDLKSQGFCKTQLQLQTRPKEQFAQIMKGLKKLPEMYSTDFMRVHAVDLASSVQICGKSFNTWTPNRGVNTSGQLTTINIGASNYPTSALTWPYLRYLTMQLRLQGYYEAGSGLGQDMFNLITDSTAWFNLTNGNPDMKEMMALGNPAQASPLYKIGEGVDKPFGNLAPTLDNQSIRFQDLGSGVLQRVYPYYNYNPTTGVGRKINPAWLQARYQISFLWHPKAIRILTPEFAAINPLVPSINSAFYGQWNYINPQGLIQITQPDGTLCTKNNDAQMWFYWLCKMQMGFFYQQDTLMMPILHLVDGSGSASVVDVPICTTNAPQYATQNYDDSPVVC